jgi:hypothetical protein
MLRFGSGALVLALASIAHAATTSGSSGGGSTGTGSSGTGDSGSGTDTGGSDSSTTEQCGDCEMMPGDVVITTPADAATVYLPFDVEAMVVQRVGCDCTEQSPMYVELYIDEVRYGDRCMDLSCSWTIDTTLGGHTLFVNATYGPEDFVGTTIGVYVHGTNDSSADTSTSGPPPSNDTSTSTGANEDSSKGCGCDTNGRSSGALWLAPFALLARRRRDRR